MIASFDSNERATILIVDDESCIVDTLSAVLSIRGFDVMEASSAEKARKLIEENGPPHLAVLDVLLPGMNGLEMCKQLKQNPQTRNVPVILITVVTRGTDLADGFWKLGTQADDFVTKPFDPFDLADRIEQLLGRSQRQTSPAC